MPTWEAGGAVDDPCTLSECSFECLCSSDRRACHAQSTGYSTEDSLALTVSRKEVKMLKVRAYPWVHPNLQISTTRPASGYPPSDSIKYEAGSILLLHGVYLEIMGCAVWRSLSLHCAIRSTRPHAPLCETVKHNELVLACKPSLNLWTQPNEPREA